MITHWWLADLPPISGILRTVFYTGLLALCVLDHPSPLHAARIIGRTEPALYTPVGLLKVLGVRWVPPRVLTVVTRLTVAAWVAAAVGFAQPVSAVLVLLGFAFLHAVNAGALGSNHSTHSALYALFCLCFSRTPAFSLDGFLAAHVSGWPVLPGGHSVLQSGFAPRLLLVFVVYIMFAGGVAKLTNGGLAWLDGRALHFYLRQSAPSARAPWLARLVTERPALCRWLARATVVVELSAPLALVNPVLRLPAVLLWCGLHLGILLLMMPAYWVQMWCYTLLIGWGSLEGVLTGRPAPLPAGSTSAWEHGPGGRALVAIGLLCSLACVVVLLRQSEQWPLTSVPMYSNGAPAAEQPLPDIGELKRLAVQAENGRPGAWRRPWVAEEPLEEVLVRPADGGEAVPLFQLMVQQAQQGRVVRFARWSQYVKAVRSVAITDVAAKPAHRPQADPTASPDHPATAFLRTLVPVLRSAVPEPARYAGLELVCRTTSGPLVIGRVPLDGDHPNHPNDLIEPAQAATSEKELS
ncbi:hypothetical protein GCM10009665_11090 [Kitasatospora nipponensis]|uniref:Vitamin K-dependent gamma-carboxylase-like protein n=2 Tax=Kitasatospora nipponensis TaxID=258049 RepID=A0ABP4GLW2_9ACTN